MNREKLKKNGQTREDRFAPYNTGIEVLAAGGVIMVIGILFQIMQADLSSRIPTGTELSQVMQFFLWIYWVGPVCLLFAMIIVLIGVLVLYRAYNKIHPRDRAQKKLTTYREDGS